MSKTFSAISQVADAISDIDEKQVDRILKGTDKFFKNLEINLGDIDTNGNTIFHYLAKSARAYKAIEAMNALYDQDPELFASTIMESAVDNGLKAMLNWHNAKGMTPLHIAAWSGNPFTFMALVGIGAYLLSENYERKLPMETAIERDHPEVVTSVTDDLVSRGDTETLRQVYTPRGGRNPLHQAAEKSSEDTIRRVGEASKKAEDAINEGRNLGGDRSNIYSHERETPGSQRTSDLLHSRRSRNRVNQRANLNPVGSRANGAKNSQDIENARRFNIVNSVDFKGNSPLIYAAGRGFLKASADLINYGADPEKPNLSGSRPLLEFLENKNHQGVELLCDYGVAVNKDLAPRVIESQLLNIVSPMVEMRLYKNNYNQRDYKENIEELANKSAKFAGISNNNESHRKLSNVIENFVGKGLDVNLKREEMQSNISRDLNRYFDVMQENINDKNLKKEKTDCLKHHRQRSSQIARKGIERVFSNNVGQNRHPDIKSTASLSSGLRRSAGHELRHH